MREGTHLKPAHTSYTPTHPHMPTHHWATNRTCTQPVNQCHSLQKCNISCHTHTHMHIHTVVTPHFETRQRNDSVPLLLPSDSVYVLACACVFLQLRVHLLFLRTQLSLRVYIFKCMCACVCACVCVNVDVVRPSHLPGSYEETHINCRTPHSRNRLAQCRQEWNGMPGLTPPHTHRLILPQAS